MKMFLNEEGEYIMEKTTEGLKKILYAGIGTVAVTAEKMKDVLDVMIEKGEMTVEQGKVLNQELKHNIKKTMKENLNVSVKANTPDELAELLGKMSPEQIELLKAQISQMEEEDIVDEEKAVAEEEQETEDDGEVDE